MQVIKIIIILSTAPARAKKKTPAATGGGGAEGVIGCEEEKGKEDEVDDEQAGWRVEVLGSDVKKADKGADGPEDRCGFISLPADHTAHIIEQAVHHLTWHSRLMNTPLLSQHDAVFFPAKAAKDNSKLQDASSRSEKSNDRRR